MKVDPFIVRYIIKVHGTVQGVGFRPYVYHYAKNLHLKGKVFNSGEGVVIDVEGFREGLLTLLKILKESPPPLARIDHIEFKEEPPCNYCSFVIVESEVDTEKKALIPPDVATCTDCKNDILNPNDRRHMYPFTNCTNCGPRFTIVTTIPYDRENTSMNKFKMCSLCEKEYHDPSDRRFHAQPVCCPSCGPTLWVVDPYGNKVADQKDWLFFIWDRLKEGKIVALKSLGGFHLCCDARNEKAIAELRLRKKRPKKPLAVMCKDIETVKRYCSVTQEEERLLNSVYSPIVVLKKRVDFDLPDILSPGINSLGVMLPYTPLHVLLFSGPFDILVMTSGNVSELPIVIDNEDALVELRHISDFLVFHNRDIINRCDDSVVKIVDGQTQFLRLSRGYVPEGIKVPFYAQNPVLGIGGEMKNNFCIIKGDKAFMSQYVGEIDTEEGRENLSRSVENFLKLLGVTIEVIAFDLHPHYMSSEIAKSIPAKRYIGCQHHHAHMVSSMVENGLSDGDIIGVVLDGTGYGEDGNLWGFEILKGNYREYTRLFHLAYSPIPGGEIAIREPWRMAVSYLYTFMGDEGKYYAEKIFGKERVTAIIEIIDKKFNTPLACGCGRLFDGISAIIGICERATYEGQAAIELGELAEKALLRQETTDEIYPYDIKDDTIYPEGLIRGVLLDRFSGLDSCLISVKFHNSVVNIIRDCLKITRDKLGLRRVVLSGGTFHNEYILKRLKSTLSSLGFEVYYHTKIPPNDGGIALGQATIALARITEDRKCA
ncbi:MAG: carbamoyltransferase HypF [Deltaproteobacteria bacterium]|nr:carbamoyltransferase HypF [Deltaproteobacteria bacterium]